MRPFATLKESKSLKRIFNTVDFVIILLNFIYAIVGAFITLAIMMLGYRWFDKITPFNTHDELSGGNTAVGIVVGSIFIGLGMAVGLVIGMGLN